MTEQFDDDARTPRVLSNSAVLAFLWRQWMRRPWLFAALVGFTLIATVIDVFIPVAAGGSLTR
ncbi:hypothetical protein AB6B38_11040 [Glycocaulis abyssi]|uniref:hypothetical protein n=1 Tax=Glycocaulis abyssi TaxID=1433403 RepID=UPI00352B03BE